MGTIRVAVVALLLAASSLPASAKEECYSSVSALLRISAEAQKNKSVVEVYEDLSAQIMMVYWNQHRSPEDTVSADKIFIEASPTGKVDVYFVHADSVCQSNEKTIDLTALAKWLKLSSGQVV